MIRSSRVLLTAFLLSAVLGIQLARIGRPYGGHFASYQGGVMAAIARNMARENFSDLLRPKTDVLIFENTRSLHLNQYPFPSVFAGVGYRFLSGSLEFWGRFEAIIFHLLSILLVGLLTKRLFSERLGWMAAVIFGLSPYTLVYGQSFMSESFSLFTFLLALWILLQSEEAWLTTVLAAAFALSISLTGRLHFIIFFPLFIFCLLQQKGSLRYLLIFTAVAFLLPAAWYGYTYYASGHWTNVHTSVFLQMGVPTSHPDYSFRECLQKLSKLFLATLLTPLLFPFFLWGWKPAARFRKGFLLAAGGVLAGILIILLAFRKVLDHDFYLYAMFPFVVFVTAAGLEDFGKRFPVFKKTGWLAVGLSLYLFLSVRIASGALYQIPPQERHAVQVAQSIRLQTSPQDRLVVAGTPAILLFYADRPCWNLDLDKVGEPVAPFLKNPRFRKAEAGEIARLEAAMKNPISWLEYYRAKGAAYLVAPNKTELESFPEFLNYLKSNFQMISTNQDGYYLFRL